MPTCDECGADHESMFTCQRCEERFCGTHRLPEKHSCPFAALTSPPDENSPNSGDNAEPEFRPRPQHVPADVEAPDKPNFDAGPDVGRDGSVVGDANASDTTSSARSTSGIRDAVTGRVNLYLWRRRTIRWGKRSAYVAIAAVIVMAVTNGSASMVVLDDVGIETTDGPSNESGVATADGFNETKTERLVHEYVNEERRAHNLAPLIYDMQLASIAGGHSADMAARGYFSHNSPEGQSFADRYEAAGYECRVPISPGSYATGAENIAKTHVDARVLADGGATEYNTEDELARGIVDGWMNSTGHRENILREYWENEGIGAVITESDAVYATQNFC